MSFRCATIAALFIGMIATLQCPTVYADALTPAQIKAKAEELADGPNSETKYGAGGGLTHCSEFVRDLVQELLAQTRPEMQGQVKDQFDALSTSSDWEKLGFAADRAGVFKQAQDDANNGKLVIVAWKNPMPTASDTGHIALIVPGALEQSGAWSMKVPQIAQAGKKNPDGAHADKSVFSKLKLSWGFGFDKAAGMEVFRYKN